MSPVHSVLPSGRSPTPAVFAILLALADGDLHGYGIMRRVEGLTDGRVRLGPGTLYRSIQVMVTEGLIEEADERPDPMLDDERRRYYRLTQKGRGVAETEAERLATLVAAARTSGLLTRPAPEGMS